MGKGLTIAQFCPKKFLTKSLLFAWHGDHVSSEHPCPGAMSFLSGLSGYLDY